MRSALTTIFLSIALCVSALANSANESKVLLEKLDQVLSMRSTYDNYFQERVSALKRIKGGLSDADQIFSLNMNLAQEYVIHSLDSTLFYLRENHVIAKKTGSLSKKQKTDISLAYVYSKAGFHLEAVEILRSYDPDNLSQELRYDYYRAYYTLSAELVAYSRTEEDHRAIQEEYRQLMLSTMEEGTYTWYNLMREDAHIQGNYEKEREYAFKMLELSKEGSQQYAEAAYFIAMTYSTQKDGEGFNWLVRSAISDVMSSTRDYQSLNSISEILFEKGEIEKAFRYAADYCLPDALAYNGKLRPWQISLFFPKIEKAYTEKIVGKTAQSKRYLSIMSLLAVLLIVTLVLIALRQRVLVQTRNELQNSLTQIDKQNKSLKSVNQKLKTLNERLSEADKVKQEYISLFLSILSENINTSRQYKNHVLKYLRRGAVAQIQEEIEALPSIDDDINQFYKMFDQTFINMYPDFVERFNELLAEGEAIYPKGDDLLSPEQRIFALVKLGISDSSRIAALLHYSANTIYNYKAKVKNKAKGDRARFEEDVKNIYNQNLNLYE